MVEEIAQKFETTRADQSDTRELAKRLADCVALLLKLKQPDTSEVAGAVVAKTGRLFATLKNGLDALALSVKDGLDTLTGMLRGLQAKADSQATQDAQRRAEDREKLAELGTGVQRIEAGVQQLQAKANEVEGAAKRIEAKADELGQGVKGLDAKTNAHHEQTGRWILALGGIMVAGFVGVIVTVVACIHAGGPIPGAGQTRGGGVAEDAARARQGGRGWLWVPPLDEGGPSAEAGMGGTQDGTPDATPAVAGSGCCAL